jgi:glycosyltransferase involved in cell wall biosynthesis
MNHRLPSIAVVAPSLEIVGGQGVQAATLVACLERDGYRVLFLPINPRFPAGLGSLRRIRGVRTIVNQLLYVPGLAALSAVDVVHVFSASYWSFLLAPVPAMLVGRGLHKHVVLHYHSGEADDHLARWGNRVHPWLRLAHEIVVPSEYLRDVFARHGYQARVVPNVVDLSRFRYRERRPLRPRILCARNLDPYYRVDVVIEAFARFMRDVPSATLTIAGYGPEEPRLRELAAVHAGNAVRFAGKVDPEAMPRMYDEHDIFVNASVVDNQPVSILEAFSAGLPVVSTSTGDIQFMVRHAETGLLVKSPDADCVAEGLRTIWRDPDGARRQAECAHDSVRRHTWHAVRDRWAAIYTERMRHDEVVAGAESH